MKKLLFVDDEPNILQGMRRMLRSMRKEYKMFFAEGGRQALELMGDESIDVVVSDMRMPGIDGAQLLTEVREQHPETIRIMLTGQADEDSILKTVGIVHQFLAKPCDPEQLKSLLNGLGGLQDRISDDLMKGVIAKIDSLPSLPATYTALQEAMAKDDVGLDEIAEIIERDMAMSAKILQLVNSAFFGLFTTVKSPAHAVNLLGFNTVKILVLGVGVFSSAEKVCAGISMDELWRHSFMVGRIARKLAEAEKMQDAMVDDCFLAGVLHDLGKLVLAVNFAEEYEDVINRVKQEDKTFCTVEKEMFSACHGDVGAYLIGLWGFRYELIEAVGCHHSPKLSTDHLTTSSIVYVADCLYHLKYRDTCPNNAVSEEDLLEFGKSMPFTATDQWQAICEEICTEE